MSSFGPAQPVDFLMDQVGQQQPQPIGTMPLNIMPILWHMSLDATPPRLHEHVVHSNIQREGQHE